jgi:hypothetical protein
MLFLLIAENRKTNMLGEAPIAEKTSKNLIISILGGWPVAEPKPMTAPKYIIK